MISANQYPPGTIIDAEHNRAIDCPDLIEAIIADMNQDSPMSMRKWLSLPREVQIAFQLEWVSGPPRPPE